VELKQPVLDDGRYGLSVRGDPQTSPRGCSLAQPGLHEVRDGHALQTGLGHLEDDPAAAPAGSFEAAPSAARVVRVHPREVSRGPLEMTRRSDGRALRVFGQRDRRPVYVGPAGSKYE